MIAIIDNNKSKKMKEKTNSNKVWWINKTFVGMEESAGAVIKIFFCK